MSSKKKPEIHSTPSSESGPETRGGFSRRGFLRGAGVSGGVLGGGLLEQQEAEAAPPPSVVPAGETSITLNINGKPMKVTVEPRTTLLDALRERLEITGAKRVCDRGTCGACTVMMDGKVAYACTVLAIDAQGRKIETIESLSMGKPHPIIQAFVDNDGMQCGYCTPGFVMASKAFLDRNPNPTYEQVKEGLGGNLCRCGTYVGVRKAVMQAAKDLKGGRNA
ncbi:MAG: (2Fe-2S)-binding protein [Bryobacteraceae bacterium]